MAGSPLNGTVPAFTGTDAFFQNEGAAVRNWKQLQVTRRRISCYCLHVMLCRHEILLSKCR